MYILYLDRDGWKMWSNFREYVVNNLPPSDNYQGKTASILKNEYNCEFVYSTLQFKTEEDAIAFKLKWS